MKKSLGQNMMRLKIIEKNKLFITVILSLSIKLLDMDLTESVSNADYSKSHSNPLYH